MQKNDVALI